MNIYEEIKKDKGYLSALAPMEGVTDTVFRQVVSEIGKPDLFFTEFLNVEGFCSKGKEEVSHRLKFNKREKPIIIQLWGNVPEYYTVAIREVMKLNPDGIDINMGCSVHDVVSKGRGSALIQNQELAKEIIKAVKQEAGNIPVSIKTRLGYDNADVNGWIRFLLNQGLDLITIHTRTSKEGYGHPTRWDEMSNCISLRDQLSPNTLILGNGNIKNIKEGKQYVKEYGIDGFMIGRGVMNNPWVFSERVNISKEERLKVLERHFELFEHTWKEKKPFNSQKKYIKMYVSGFKGANQLRKELMDCNNLEELKKQLKSYT